MRLVRDVWHGRSLAAQLARALLLPLSLLYGAVARARAAAYRARWLRTRALPLPAIAVGNLSVGGTGKTPVTAWIAAFLAKRGVRPGILLRGYGGDEQLVHQQLVPEAVVVANPDRLAGASQARAAGARIVVLDDAYQRLDLARDLNVVLVAAEAAEQPVRLLPAGPWREGWGALRRADVIVVTRRRASAADATALLARIDPRPRPRRPGSGGPLLATVHLAVEELVGMRSGRRVPLGTLAGKRVIVAAGIADPESLAAQIEAVGATVQLMAYQDHHPYPAADIARLAEAARSADYCVVTLKDAVKLRGRWPEGGGADVPEPLVADLTVRWEMNGDAMSRLLEGMLQKAL
jgi:tetraacyldisaccharide 4'-kinase